MSYPSKQEVLLFNTRTVYTQNCKLRGFKDSSGKKTIPFDHLPLASQIKLAGFYAALQSSSMALTRQLRHAQG